MTRVAQRRTGIVSARFDLYRIAQEHAKDLPNRFRRALLSRKIHRLYALRRPMMRRHEWEYKIIQPVPMPVYMSVYILNVPKIAYQPSYLALAFQCTHTTAISHNSYFDVFAFCASSCVSIAPSVRISHALYTICVYHHVYVQIAPAPRYDM